MCTASSLSWDCFSLALSCDRDRAQVVHLSLAAVPWKRCERHCNVKDFNVLIFQCRCCRTIRTWLNNISDAHLNSCSSGVVESCRRCSYSNQQLIRNGLIGISFKRDGAMPNRQREHPCSSRSTRSYDLLGTTLQHSRCQLLNYIIRRRLWQTLLYGSCQAYR